ncbi:TMV resistance protein N-like [Dorcoceras hygrometricum]|uniref:TMV resistance protein N-like n=1 Tax=Dorcoceras hygrometricum TaxID=472368 RepID=A0A2Z7BSW2_9LAMI|nr:TMV resistance protein N-like [Dorcoceras hygrometricum]
MGKEMETESVDDRGRIVDKPLDSDDMDSLSKILELSVSPTSDDESLSIEEHLANIPDDMILPSVTTAKMTKIKFACGIEIKGVTERDWYKANLPQIAADDKGKKLLQEPDTIKGHPAREQFQLLCGDIEFLVQIKEKVIEEMSSFFHSFSLQNLKAMKSVKYIAPKEEKMLEWAETDSLEIAVRRRMYIIANYR